MTDATKAGDGNVVELRDARVGYRGRTLIEDIDLAVTREDFLAVVGPNGSGKTTLLRTLLGVIRPRGGRRRVSGQLGYTPQRSSLDPIFPFTTHEVVSHGLFNEDPERRDKNEELERIGEAIRACGLGGHEDTPFRELSGGQRQRGLIARALVTRPDLLVLDEPTNNLDVRGEHEVMSLVERLFADGCGVLMVSHQLHVVARHARRIALILNGRLVVGDREEMLAPTRLRELYGMDIDLGSGGPPATVGAPTGT